MDIAAVMKRQVVSISDQATLEQAIRKLVEARVGMLPVVDAGRTLVGILTLRDVLHLAFPSLTDKFRDYDFVHDFGALELGSITEEQRAKPVVELMSEPTSVPADTGLLRAEATMRQHDLRDLPVVDAQGRLVGLASWVDVGVAYLDAWCRAENKP